MVRSLKWLFAVIVAALLGTAAIAPASAAGLPTGAAINVERASRLDLTDVGYRHRAYRHRAFHHRRVYYHRPVYRYRPVYRHHVYHRRPIYRPRYVRPIYYHPVRPAYRRCVIRPQWVWTHYGYVHRNVRVCRW